MAETVEVKKRPGPIDDKIHTWPHLVRGEFLVTIFVIVVLTLWALLLDAPLEEPANPTRTPNPSKAPWYFLGLQEMLVYFDPWHAGVVLPTFIIIGLMVIPFIDINPAGNGYYTYKEVALTKVDLPYLIGIRSETMSILFGIFCVVAYFVIGIAAFYGWVVRVKGKEFMERWGPVRFGIT